MRGAVLFAPGDVRVDERDDLGIVEPTDAMNALPGWLPPLVGNDTAATQGPAPTVVVGSAFRR